MSDPPNARVETAPIRAGLYLRCSTVEQHPENQLPDLDRRAEYERWVVFDRYVDAGVSGARASRPALDRLLGDAKAHRFDVVLVWSVSRFGRDMIASVLHMHELLELGIRLVFLKEGIDSSTPIGRGCAAMLAALAEQELEEKRARVRAGMERVKATRRDGRKGTERTRTGRPLGRPRVPLDSALVMRLHVEGLTLRAIAAKMPPWTDAKGKVHRVNRRAVQRCLARGAHNPAPEGATQPPATTRPSASA
jgi:DNA invertase Pin-like site-specific DNA recombinase